MATTESNLNEVFAGQNQANRKYLAFAKKAKFGHIIAEMLERFIQDLAAPIYYIAGPPAPVDAMRDMLGKAGAYEDDIHSENFVGY